MAQLNLHVTAEFERALAALMKGRGVASKSQAIRDAVQEAAAPYLASPKRDFSLLRGMLDRHAPLKTPRRPMAEFEREIDDGMEQALNAPPGGRSVK